MVGVFEVGFPIQIVADLAASMMSPTNVSERGHVMIWVIRQTMMTKDLEEMTTDPIEIVQWTMNALTHRWNRDLEPSMISEGSTKDGLENLEETLTTISVAMIGEAVWVAMRNLGVTTRRVVVWKNQVEVRLCHLTAQGYSYAMTPAVHLLAMT